MKINEYDRHMRIYLVKRENCQLQDKVDYIKNKFNLPEDVVIGFIEQNAYLGVFKISLHHNSFKEVPIGHHPEEINCFDIEN